MPFTLAIVGRPNVGKSTLFNRLAGKKWALVGERPGLTRDWREGRAHIGETSIRIIDTAGVEDTTDAMARSMRHHVEDVLTQADAILLVIDARGGVTAPEVQLARDLRKYGKPVLPVANKCEGRNSGPDLGDSDSLGLGPAVAISAAHGDGMSDLYRCLIPLIDATRGEEQGVTDQAFVEQADALPVRIAVVGRPNAGKSTLINRLLGQQRLLTSDQPGTTRDAIRLAHRWEGQNVILTDTAGLKRAARVVDCDERAAAQESYRAIRLCQVGVLVLDATRGLDRQDMRIARHICEEGRACVIGVNKMDRIAPPSRSQTLATIRQRLDRSLPQMRGVTITALSALHGEGLAALQTAITQARDVWDRRIATAVLNDWLNTRIRHHPPPLAGDKRQVKLRYMTQIKARPPTFVLFVNRAQAVPESYRRFLVNGLREDFDLWGVPLRLHVKTGQNPYVKSASRRKAGRAQTRPASQT